ncbi:winged helix-turn-helix transcriptional regulator [Yinghuangia soli]|uniref:Winged helix-turn-helix transcriptional regulator n=1 Tax=Yinghuangia soli TaxID=2908204 RepID=A0AA41U2S9_9ACTN|nr:winged helix-turn-helix transcriptional regulator [Yinghuangia soli]MCF2528992.1 winged helix-turn-helix transcriptional regulator [Yinghuangia soli]
MAAPASPSRSSSAPGSARRSYGQACPIAHALDIVGERWALLVVRELRLGPRRYADLQAALPGAGSSVLAQRLRDLEATGVLRRRTLPPPAAAKVYELTEWGAELEPVFDALRTWGMRSPVVPLTGEITADTVFLGLRAFFAATPETPWTASFRFVLERDVYRVDVVDGRLAGVVRGDTAAAPDVEVTGDQRTLQAVLTHQVPLKKALAAGTVAVTGGAAGPGHLERLVDALPRRG